MPDSRRERADCLVPIICASCFWVKPFLARWRIMAAIISYSGPRRSYSALISGSLRAWLRTL